MPLLSSYARKKKIGYFLRSIPAGSRVLEIGSGSGWVRDYFRTRPNIDYTGLDRIPPADITGDINDWRELGLSAGSFDYVVAFEVVEHADCWQASFDLLRPGGKLLVTTPHPNMDWFLKILETAGLNQKRTSPHNHLISLKGAPCFTTKNIRIVGFSSQWGVFTK